MANQNQRETTRRTVQGSVPFGNPKRYASADVIQMPKDVSSDQRAINTRDGDETNNFIQTLLQHQTQTHITLKEQFSKHRSFSISSSHAPSVNKLDGLHTSSDHVKLNEFDAQVSYLRSCGLTEKEINFKLKQDSSTEDSKNKIHGFGPDPASEDLIKQEIDRKLLEKEESLKKPDRFNGGVEISRQAMILEKAILAKKNKDSVPDCLFKQKKLVTGHPDDPINHINDILTDIEPKASREPRRERRRKRKLNNKLLRQQEYFGVNSDPAIRKKFMKSVGLEAGSLSPDILNLTDGDENGDDDYKGLASPKSALKSEHLEQNKNEIKNNKLSSADFLHGKEVATTSIKRNQRPKSNTFTISSWKSPVPFLAEEEIQSNRLSVEDIDRFKNYEKGIPNKTLFVKNLPTNVTETDLISLFGRFQQNHRPEISFRLLKGRMKGQAFITMPDEKVAGEAITQLNGFKLKEKPMILCFGKRQDNSIEKQRQIIND